MTSYLTVFAVAAVVTFLATPLVRRFVIRAGAIYKPNDRTVHKVPLPTMGGIAMYMGLVAALIASQVLPFFRQLNLVNNSAAVLVTCTLMLGIGVIDDTRGVQPLTKLVAQIFVGGVLVLLGVVLSYFWLPGLGLFILSGDLPVIITIIWVVAVANAVNLADGLDGLAAGMVGIAAAVFFVYSVLSPGPLGIISQPALLAAITCGVCVGFLPWNFHPAKIFMGDAGSMLLGMLLSITTIEGVHRTITTPSGGDIAAVAGTIGVPILVLLIPFLDVAYAIVRRTRRGQGIAYADKEHLHHHLMEIGHGHTQAVLLMYLWSALLSAGALAVWSINGRGLVSLILVGAVILGAAALFLVTALPRLNRRAGGGHRNGSRYGQVTATIGNATTGESDGTPSDAPQRNDPDHR